MNRAIITMLILAFFIVSFSGLGCSCPDEEDAGNIQPWITDLMRRLPEDILHVQFNDLEALRREPALHSEYTNLVHMFEEGSPWGIIGRFEQVQYWAASDSVHLFAGELQLAEMRTRLRSEGWCISEYQGVELWGKEGWQETYVALDDGIAIAGSETGVEHAIRVLVGQSKSLHDNNEALGVLSRLPRGLVVSYSEVEWWSDSGRSDTVLFGSSLAADVHAVRCTLVATSRSAEVTESFVQARAQLLESEEGIDPSRVVVSQEGWYVKLVAEVPITTAGAYK